jgi:hypothetical protein
MVAVQVQVPNGVHPGQSIRFLAPGYESYGLFEAQVPANCYGGQVFFVEINIPGSSTASQVHMPEGRTAPPAYSPSYMPQGSELELQPVVQPNNHNYDYNDNSNDINNSYYNQSRENNAAFNANAVFQAQESRRLEMGADASLAEAQAVAKRPFLKAIFHLLDKHVLDIEQGILLFHHLDITCTETLTKKEIDDSVKHNNTVIEFLETYRKTPLGLLTDEEKVHQVFDKIDADNNGVIELHEWKFFLAELVKSDASYAVSMGLAHGNYFL